MTTSSGFAKRYADALARYGDSRDEAALSEAYELGRSAVRQGLSVLDLASAQQEALLAIVERGRHAPGDAVAAAGEFFVEALSAFEMVQRALQETREAAAVERRQGAVLRQLSTFLGDASIALDAPSSLAEMLQLVAEHAREVIGAERCLARLVLDEGRTRLAAEAHAREEPAAGASQVDLKPLFDAIEPPGGVLRMGAAELRRHPAREALDPSSAGGGDQAHAWLAASLTALDGRSLGLIQLFREQDGEFSEFDEAVLVQLAQMASAAVERTLLYRGSAS